MDELEIEDFLAECHENEGLRDVLSRKLPNKYIAHNESNFSSYAEESAGRFAARVIEIVSSDKGDGRI